jgi:poly-gamma-glutamate synthesis protein (capsule biosynthesis protein)
MDSLLARVARLRAADPQSVIIVSLHWGAEHTLTPVPAQRLDAHRLIDAGADALVCHHTHTLQTIETYRGRPIYYSLGNFIFDQQQPINTRAAMVQFTVTPDTLTATTIPLTIRRCAPACDL